MLSGEPIMKPKTDRYKQAMAGTIYLRDAVCLKTRIKPLSKALFLAGLFLFWGGHWLGWHWSGDHALDRILELDAVQT